MTYLVDGLPNEMWECNPWIDGPDRQDCREHPGIDEAECHLCQQHEEEALSERDRG